MLRIRKGLPEECPDPFMEVTPEHDIQHCQRTPDDDARHNHEWRAMADFVAKGALGQICFPVRRHAYRPQMEHAAIAIQAPELADLPHSPDAFPFIHPA